ncbi:hypothetical protein JB92DRAFT_3093269 [Gautieria morchelliformis]|nr:hypothetical protein JB92DRAFT_3093269 [Gautieria morchelliformis]
MTHPTTIHTDYIIANGDCGVARFLTEVTDFGTRVLGPALQPLLMRYATIGETKGIVTSSPLPAHATWGIVKDIQAPGSRVTNGIYAPWSPGYEGAVFPVGATSCAGTGTAHSSGTTSCAGTATLSLTRRRPPIFHHFVVSWLFASPDLAECVDPGTLARCRDLWAMRRGEGNPRLEVDPLLSEERLDEDFLYTGELGADTTVVGTLKRQGQAWSGCCTDSHPSGRTGEDDEDVGVDIMGWMDRERLAVSVLILCNSWCSLVLVPVEVDKREEVVERRLRGFSFLPFDAALAAMRDFAWGRLKLPKPPRPVVG